MLSVANWFFGASTRASPENPSTSLSAAADWLYDALGAQPSATGVRVSADAALGYDAVWRAVKLISEQVAKLPLITYRRVGGGKDRDPSHPAYSLLKYAPNEHMTEFSFRQAIQAHVLLHGNGYAWIERDAFMAPLALWPLDPVGTYPVRENGMLWYVTNVPRLLDESGSIEQIRIPEVDVLHVKGLGYDGLAGYSVLRMARDSLGLGIASRDYTGRFFRNNARPGVVIEAPGPMTPQAQQEFLRQWNEMHAGVNNQHRTAILTNGAKIAAMQLNARDSQLLEQRQFSVREVANWFGLPPHKLGDDSRTAFASLEQENQSFLDESLDPWLKAWESECRSKLLTEEQKDRDTHAIEFLRLALLRADAATRATFYAAMLQNGVMNRDEVRAREDLNPLPNQQGERFFVPLNMQLTDLDGEVPDEDPLSEPEPASEPEPEEDDDDRSDQQGAILRQWAQAEVDRAINKLCHIAAKKAAKPREYMQWVEAQCQTERDGVVRGFERMAAANGSSGDAAADVILATISEKLWDISGRYTYDDLAEGVTRELEAWKRSASSELCAKLLEGSNGSH